LRPCPSLGLDRRCARPTASPETTGV
jgi:hypothetical protein